MKLKSFFSVARAVAWRQIHNSFTNPAILLPSLVFPLFFLVAFAGGLSNLGNAPGFDFPAGYTAFQFVWALLQSAANGGVFGGFAIASDFESGFARRLLLAAPQRSGIVLGYVLAALARTLLTIVVLTVAALLSGMNVLGSPLQMLGLFALAALLNIAGTLWAAGIALRFRTVQSGSLMQTPVFLAMFLAPVFVPLPLLTGWIRAAATANPVTTLLDAGRALISGQPSRFDLAVLVSIALISAFTVWAMLGLRRAERAA